MEILSKLPVFRQMIMSAHQSKRDQNRLAQALADIGCIVSQVDRLQSVSNKAVWMYLSPHYLKFA